jgi:type I restriction enzyme S subunit
MKRVLFETARGAIGQANINAKELKAFRVAAPPLQIQERFECYCREVTDIQTQQSVATAKAQAAFDALLHRFFGAPA